MSLPPTTARVTLAERYFGPVPTLIVVVKTGCCILDPNQLVARAFTHLLLGRLAANAQKSWAIYQDEGVMLLIEVKHGAEACATALAFFGDACILDSVEIGYWDPAELFLRGYHLPFGGNFESKIVGIEYWWDYRVKL